MKFEILSTITLALVAATPTVIPTTGDRPDPSLITIKSLGYAGTGCPAGSVSSNMNRDATAVTLIFDQYVASAGPGIPITQLRKNCQVNVGVRVPNGWQYSIATVDYRGFYALDSGVTATQSAKYYFQGEVVECKKETKFVGPKSGDYTLRDAFASGCGAKANVNINSAISLRAASGKSGLITTDSIDLKVKQIFGIQFRRC